MRFVKECLLNWRWWVALPVCLILWVAYIPSFLIYVLNDLFDWLRWGVAYQYDVKLTSVIRPLNKWIYQQKEPTNDN